MKKYNFIKISNNNNPSQDFYIDITTMKSVTLRMQILKSQMLQHRRTGEGLYRPSWYYIESTDYSYYKLDEGKFDTHQEAREHAIKLYNEQFIKMNQNVNNTKKNVNKLLVTFD